MIIFLFISIAFMQNIQHVIQNYKDTKVAIYEELNEVFAKDFLRWDAEFDSQTLTVSFRSPDVLFDQGSVNLKPRFQQILDDFFPRYIAILSKPEYRDSIQEIRIEGHTSSEWKNPYGIVEHGTLNSYLYNMNLSQKRTLEVLKYCIQIDKEKYFEGDSDKWLIKRLTANGLSFSHPKFKNKDSLEDYKASRRVDFRIRTDADEKIAELERKTE